MNKKIVAALALLCAGCNAVADSKAGKPKRSTAQPGVSLLPAELAMPGLDRKRQVRLYLPPGYATSGKRYPVLYMHDGQNLFDAATAHDGEWQVDEIMDGLAGEGKLELIVVAIDNGKDKRMTELNPWDDAEFGSGEGERYMDFVVKTVKPRIDAQYRTMPERANTGLMGSSMGGLISHYGIHRYPDVFSKAGLFSPAYIIGNEMFNYAGKVPARSDARMYLLVGDQEGQERVDKAVRMGDHLVKLGLPPANRVVKVVPGGQHNEAFWQAEFREAVLWMFAKP